MNAGINKEFIFSYLAGKSSALQKQMVDEWVKEPANEELFYKWLVEYEYQHPQYLTVLPEAIERFHAFADRYDKEPETVHIEEETGLPERRWAWIGWAAASLALLLLGGSGIHFKDELRYKTYTSSFGQTRTLLLSDSTRVVLNANSALRVPRFGFGTSTREVFLKGEADFAVTHQPNDQKFVVKTEKALDVVVLGTEFTVYSRQQKARVVLNKGKVQLRFQEGQRHKQVLMKPGDLVMLDEKNQLRQQVTPQPENHSAWKEHRFVFDDTTLGEFANLMEEHYGIHVRIDSKALSNRTLVGSFQAESPEELLDIVTNIFGIKAVRTGNTVLLTNHP